MCEYKIELKELISVLKTGKNAKIEFYNDGKCAILPADDKNKVNKQPLAIIIAGIDLYNLCDYDPTGSEYTIAVTEKWLKIKGLNTIWLNGDIATLQVTKDFFE